MKLKYKDDFERTRQYFDAYWQKEVIDRPLIGVTCPKRGMETKGHCANSFTTLNAGGNHEKFIQMMDSFEQSISTLAFLGEAIPYVNMDFGPDMYASFYGAEIFPAEKVGTTWVKPMIEDWADFDGKIDLSEEGTYNKYFEILAWAAEYSKDKFYISCPDSHSNLDALSALRGAENLCCDIIDDPDMVDHVMGIVRKDYKPFFDKVSAVLDTKNRGSMGWIPTYCKDRFATIQCDAICLISPEHARRYVIPALIEESEVHDHSVYHLDGKDALRHLDDILAIEKIDAIQWVPGDGNPRSVEWLPLLQKIQAAGKGLWIYDWTAEEIKTYYKELKPEGLFFSTWVGNEDEGEALLEYMVKNT